MNNPVAWQNWGPEALALAKKSNRLIFISIGYAACHWCHVMERESFENAEVAALLNSSFIPIKIDREERPDVDRIYMNYVQATSGSGGWPLNVFITPDLEPIFGGTYWPGPGSTMAMGDHIGFVGILEKIRDVWKNQQQRCLDSAKEITAQLREFADDGSISRKENAATDGLDLELLEEAYEHFEAKYDGTFAGFGGAPKFPTPSNLSFLLKLSQYPSAVTDVLGAKDCTKAKDMVLATLTAMNKGGIHDQIGNGFSRYSVTKDWSLPHFEKMQVRRFVRLGRTNILKALRPSAITSCVSRRLSPHSKSRTSLRCTRHCHIPYISSHAFNNGWILFRRRCRFLVQTR